MKTRMNAPASPNIPTLRCSILSLSQQCSSVVLVQSSEFCFSFSFLQFVTALLVAGSTPTFWIPQFVSTSSYLSVVQALGCSHSCRRLTYGLFQLTHMSRDDHAVQVIEPWRPKLRQNIITALTMLPQGWLSARKHQHTTAITTMWTESSWAFPESYTADDSSIVRSSDGGHGETKGLITPPPRWVSAQLLYVCVTAW